MAVTPESAGAVPDVFVRACPSRAVLARVANKWSLLVIQALDTDAPARNGHLLRRIEGISQRMLTETLRELETLGLVERTVHDVVPPHVEYRLTTLGASLRDQVCALNTWIEANVFTMIDQDG